MTKKTFLLTLLSLTAILAFGQQPEGTPAFDYRHLYYYLPENEPGYAERYGLHTVADQEKDWGMWVHTFQHLIPQELYFERKPEWFSMVGGRRVSDGQLCLSNPEMLEELCRRLDSMMALKEECRIWSVSNNDNYNACQCPACLRQDSLYGGPSGTLIHFVNEVARRHPDKVISTLAYQYTRQAPRQDAPQPQRPRGNVNVMFCSIECDRSRPIADNPREAAFVKDMEDWAALTDNILVWDYVVQFRNFLNVFPNLHVLGPNLRFFRDHGVRAIFEQGCRPNRTSWDDLRGYLLARLMWDPDLNTDTLIHHFCHEAYGAAEPYVVNILRRLEESVVESGMFLNIYGYPIDAAESYLSAANRAYYKEQFAQAYRALEGDSAGASRLRYFEIPFDFAEVDIAIQSEGQPCTEAQIARLQEDCHRYNLLYTMEMGYSIDSYCDDLRRCLSKGRPNKAQGKPVSLLHPPAPQYAARGPQSLTDGVGGITNYSHNWLGFFGDTLQATIDLGHKQRVDSLLTDFYCYPLSWIFLPESVVVETSCDGRHWKASTPLQLATPQSLALPSLHTISLALPRGKARYVRLTAVPLPSIPAWHRAMGNPAWTFIDEIILR